MELDLFGGAFANMSHLQWVKVCTGAEICIGRLRAFLSQHEIWTHIAMLSNEDSDESVQMKK